MTQPRLDTLLSAFQDEFPVLLQPPNETVDREQLFVDLGVDKQERPRYLELILLPDQGDDLLYLQMFAGLPFAYQPQHAAELARFIVLLNAKLPLVGFGMLEDPGPMVIFRVIVPCAQQKLDGDLIVGTAWVISYMVDLFSDLLEQVGTGQLGLEQALASADALAAQPPGA